MIDDLPASGKARKQGNAAEVFGVFLKLGLTSFGGPTAHLGYFRDELVTRRQWLTDDSYAGLLALCQFLPGPASSQMGFALGMMRAGWWGAIAAFTAFTLPSALILFLFAMTAVSLAGPLGAGALHGLQIVAVAIVAQAVWSMARSLCPDLKRATIAIAATAFLVMVQTGPAMIAAILLGGLLGMILLRGSPAPIGTDIDIPVTKAQGITALTLFVLLLAGLPLIAGLSQTTAVIDSFYRAGSLVFGGGHVVLPLLQAEVVDTGWISAEDFMTGYGAAQAVPGPLFTFAAYLGALLGPEPNGYQGATLALMALFMPGFLLVTGALPFWQKLHRTARIRYAIQGANAAVVGVLAAALYSPLFTTAIINLRDLGLAALCLAALMIRKAPPWVVVLMGAAGGVVLNLI